jgi:hypothetical protein
MDALAQTDQVAANQRDFFAYARERHLIYLRRRARDPWPWTDDPILRTYRFTNIFRELDRTTQWFAKNVREPLRGVPEVLLATVLFRWFNRIATGEVIFNQGCLGLNGEDTSETPWDSFLRTRNVDNMRAALYSAYPNGPYVTGSYMIRSPTGLSKLDGMLKLCEDFYRDSNWRATAKYMLRYQDTRLEGFSRWLERSPGQGKFLAYEVATDLRHTDLLCHAPDIDTWANVGPGCLRGLNRIYGRVRENPRKPKHKYGAPIPENQALAEMGELLRASRWPENWPAEWPQWELREVEMTLCETDKYARVMNSEGTPRQLYRPPA